MLNTLPEEILYKAAEYLSPRDLFIFSGYNMDIFRLVTPLMLQGHYREVSVMFLLYKMHGKTNS